MSYPLTLPTKQPLVTVTNPKPHLWVIELHNGQDSRLTVDLIDHGLKPALDAVEKHWRQHWRVAQGTKGMADGKGALIIVGRKDQDKFFSNGLDFPSVGPNPNFFPSTYNPLLVRLLTFPIPIIAAINGHCYAGAFILSLTCDYRVMTDGKKRNAWLCMNEIHFGASWPLSLAAIVRAKVHDSRLQRKIALEGHKFTPAEAHEAGLIDRVVAGGTTEVLSAAEELAESLCGNARTGVWGLIKGELYRDTIRMIQKDLRSATSASDDALAKARL